MGKKVDRRIIYAWVMLMALMPVFLAKTFHYHDNSEVVAEQTFADHGHSHNSPCDNCPVCHFALSPFEKSANTEVHTYFSVIGIEPILQETATVTSSAQTPQLRAPPFMMA